MTITAFTNKTDAKTAQARLRSEFFGTGRVVSVSTEKSMGSDFRWFVTVGDVNRPGIDTSCRNCGGSTHTAKDCFR